jgi:hypothetical protein
MGQSDIYLLKFKIQPNILITFYCFLRLQSRHVLRTDDPSSVTIFSSLPHPQLWILQCLIACAIAGLIADLGVALHSTRII